MFGIGTPELILIIVLALLIIGPKDLPRIGRELGKLVRSFQDAIHNVESDINKEIKGIGIEDPLKGTRSQDKQEDIKG